MIKHIGIINKQINLAFSGGIDSVAAALFYKRGNRNVTLYHFNHGCEYSDTIEKECIELANKLELPIIVGKNTNTIKPKQSLEDFWRRSRYKFLYESLNDGDTIVTAHHLNDAIETWVWSSMHGESKLIQPSQTIDYHGKTIVLRRPFLLNNKKTMADFVSDIDIVLDESNNNNKLIRNYIRNVMMDNVLVVNPGIEKTIRKKYLSLL